MGSRRGIGTLGIGAKATSRSTAVARLRSQCSWPAGYAPATDKSPCASMRQWATPAGMRAASPAFNSKTRPRARQPGPAECPEQCLTPREKLRGSDEMERPRQPRSQPSRDSETSTRIYGERRDHQRSRSPPGRAPTAAGNCWARCHRHAKYNFRCQATSLGFSLGDKLRHSH
jgi:hypothetical protein